jgi:cytochrome c553
MRRFIFAVMVLALPLALVGAKAAQNAPAGGGAPVGTAEAGKATWATGNTSCRNCHGDAGEGMFGPTLAGRNFTFEKFRAYVRNPLGRMPGWVQSELTDQEMADLVAYFNSLPPAKPGKWRTALPENSSRGQQLAVAMIGCGQCHGDTLDTPRHGAGEVNGDWEWFKNMVYNHPQAQKDQWALLDPKLPRVTPGPAGPPGRNRVRMGMYSRTRLPEATLREIFDWINDLGYLPPLSGQIVAGAADANGTTYTINVANAGVAGKGVAAEDVMIQVALPAGAKVVTTTGDGYQGVKADAEGKANVAVWRVPKMAAADVQKFTMTLSPAATALRGKITWGKPVAKADGEVNIQLAGARGRGPA